MEIRFNRPFDVDGNMRPEGVTINALNENITRKLGGD